MSKKRYCLAMVCLVGVFCVSIKAQPLAQYTFNDGTSKDVTGNGYDGVLLGGAVVVTDSERGQVLQVNQSGMQADGPFEITTSFTLSAWVKLDVPRTGRFYFGGPWQIRTDNQGSSEHYWCEFRYPGGSFVDKFDTRSGNSPEGQLDGQWHHIVVVLPEDGTIKAYVDGALAPVRDNNTKTHNFEGAVGPLFFGTQDADGANAIMGYMDDIRVFNYVVGEADILGLMVEVEGLGHESARKPDPSSGASDVLRDVILGWKPGEFAPPVNGHIVYISDSFNDVNDGIGGIVQDANSYARPQRLDFETTYYWRVDEVNAPPTSTVYRGSVWSFTTEAIANPIDGNNITATASSAGQDMGPENTINGSGLDANDLHSTESTDMWLSSNEPNGAWIEYEFDKVYKLHEMLVWNYNREGLNTIYGLRDVIIEHSTDGTSWTQLSDVPEFPKAPGTDDYEPSIVNIGNVIARYVKITANSNWIGGMFNQYGLSEVRFMAIPVFARESSPDSGATGVDPSIVLGWRAGRDAASHDVYLSSDEQDVIDGNAPVTTMTEASYGPLSLDLGTTYYWKINEVNEAETTTTWQGEIWNFTTHEFFVVDDFEDYNDYQPDEIWRTWPDGYGVPANGATVGYPDPVDFLAGEHYVETTIVHGGKQAMPFFYDNTGTATYSEGKRTFAVPQNWTKAGVQTLVLYVHGTIGNTGQLYVKVNDKKVVYDPGTIVTPPGWLAWKQWNIDLASVGTDLSSVNTLAIGVDGAWATGVMYIDDILLYKSAPPAPKVLTWFEAESGTITSPMNIYAGDITASAEQYIGTDEELGDETGTPPEDGIATYSFSVPGGVYKLVLRIVATSGSNTFWVRIPNATTNTTNHPASGWVLFDQPQLSDDWQWTEVTSRNDDDQVVEFTLPAGTHTLEVARREDGTLLDAIAIVSLTD